MTFSLQDVQVSYALKHQTPKVVLDGITLSVQSGECLGIIGHEGAGKSTLLQVLAGLVKADRGCVFVDGADMREAGAEIRKGIGFAFQFPEEQFFCETVEDELLYAVRNFRHEEPYVNPREALRMVGLQPGLLARSPYSLSVGEGRRVALALLFMMHPRALLLDEPTVGLDGGGISTIIEVLRKVHTDGVTAIVVSHDIDFLAEVATRIVILESGKLAADGSADDLLVNEQLLTHHGYRLPEVVVYLSRFKERTTGSHRTIRKVEDAGRFVKQVIKR